MPDFKLEPAVLHQGHGWRTSVPKVREDPLTMAPGRVGFLHPSPPHPSSLGQDFGFCTLLSLCLYANPLQVCSLNHLHKISPEDSRS